MVRSPRESGLAVVSTLRERGHVAYFAGGCVRDELLGQTPKDYDVATDATPDEVGSLFRDHREVGKAFGVMLVRPGRGMAVVEVATFRRESGYQDARRPSVVEFADEHADARRRDFTINALFIDPLDTRLGPGGRVIDHVGGLADLDARTIRAVGDPDERLAEDHLRALRAVRFTARLGFTLEDATAAAVHRHARSLAGVSRERVGDEMRRMLAHPSRAAAASLIQRLGLDGPALGEECRPSAGVAVMAGLRREASFERALAAWAIDRAGGLDAPADTLAASSDNTVSGWRQALCLSNDERAMFAAILAGAPAIELHWADWSVASRKRAAASGWWEGALEIMTIRQPEAGRSIAQQVEELAAVHGGLSPQRWVTGDHLVAAGITPGPRFGKWLEEIYDAQLEGRVATPAEALARVIEWSRG